MAKKKKKTMREKKAAESGSFFGAITETATSVRKSLGIQDRFERNKKKGQRNKGR